MEDNLNSTSPFKARAIAVAHNPDVGHASGESCMGRKVRLVFLAVAVLLKHVGVAVIFLLLIVVFSLEMRDECDGCRLDRRLIFGDSARRATIIPLGEGRHSVSDCTVDRRQACLETFAWYYAIG